MELDLSRADSPRLGTFAPFALFAPFAPFKVAETTFSGGL